MSNINKILTGLNGVKSTGKNKWVAKCCAHEDRSPSLAIKQLDDGRILLHCFAGCGVDEIVGVLGLELSDLFADKIAKSERRPFDAYQILECLKDESMILVLAGNDVLSGVINPDGLLRAQQAHERISAACDMARGK